MALYSEQKLADIQKLSKWGRETVLALSSRYADGEQHLTMFIKGIYHAVYLKAAVNGGHKILVLPGTIKAIKA